MTQPHRFAIASREESWLQTRVICGRLQERDGRIDADDRGDPELTARCEAVLEALRDATPELGKRFVATARRAGRHVVASANVALATGGLSIVSDREHVKGDVEWLRRIASIAPQEPAGDYRRVPLLWLRGAGSVLLHEAVGHAAETHQRPLEWPEWLRVTDVPEGPDDTGAGPQSADLLAGEAPRALRRESFVHPALPRMSSLVAVQHGAPFELPHRRIEIHVLSGGHYEPLTDTVTLFVAAADLVDGSETRRLAPFTIEEKRTTVARSLTGARRHMQRYPGVICSSEGQELFVGSAAPELLTVF